MERDRDPNVDHPDHYGGKDNPYEAIKIIEALNLGFCDGNAMKYLVRAGKKGIHKEVEDLKKAIWYLRRHLANKEDRVTGEGVLRAKESHEEGHTGPAPVAYTPARY